MSDEIVNKEFEVTELDDQALEDVSGGGIAELVKDVDALGCTDNGNCPSCTTNSGNCVAGCT